MIASRMRSSAFLSTPSARRATEAFSPSGFGSQFLSTPSARRATHDAAEFDGDRGISIHALREEGDTGGEHCAPSSKISIHALREEGDGWLSVRSSITRISIHALREEGDTGGMPRPRAVKVFLSTPSARRATCESYVQEFYSPISIHALREEGDAVETYQYDQEMISIHALREEGDDAASASDP